MSCEFSQIHKNLLKKRKTIEKKKDPMNDSHKALSQRERESL